MAVERESGGGNGRARARAGGGDRIGVRRAGGGRPAAARRGSPTSWSWSGPTRSAAPGATTAIPGCACDVPSHLYSFSFAPNPEWPRTFSGQPHIRAYLERVTDTFGLRPHLRFDAEVRQAALGRRGAALGGRDRRAGALTADVVVSGDRPAVGPEDSRTSPGWTPSPARSSTPPAGTTTTTCAASASPMVGTGASAIQIVPAIQPDVGAPHRLPAHPALGAAARGPQDQRGRALAAHQAPGTRAARRGLLWGIRELQVSAFTKRPKRAGPDRGPRQAPHAQGRQGPGAAGPLTPDYRIGCKRILLSNTYYPALAQPNADLVASGLKEVRGSHAGRRRRHRDARSDAIVFGTGFHVTDMPIAHRVTGADGTHARRGVEGRHGGAARLAPRPASPTSSPSSGPTPASGTAR